MTAVINIKVGRIVESRLKLYKQILYYRCAQILGIWWPGQWKFVWWCL